MRHPTLRPLATFVVGLSFAALSLPLTHAAPAVPDKLIVLTFDDSSASHYAVARPVLKRYGFGATFFITEGFTFAKNKTDYMTWAQIAELHRDGFEIGNHTRDHLSITEKTVPRLAEQLAVIADRCREHGIPAPVSFAWPGNKFHVAALPILQAAGIRFARRGGEPEIPYSIGGGVAYEPGLDHPLLIPTTGDARPTWTLENLQRAVAMARNGRIAVLQFHGYSGHSGDWLDKFGWPAEGFCYAAMDCRGQGGRSEDSGRVKGTTLRGHIVRGLDDPDPRNLAFRQIFLDTAQLARVVMNFPEVDADRVGCFGAS